MDIVQL